MANPKSKSGHVLRGHLRHTGDAVVVGTAACPSATLTTGTSSGCGTVESGLLREIARTPSAFYVNVRTATYPNGQVQGTLSR